MLSKLDETRRHKASTAIFNAAKRHFYRNNVKKTEEEYDKTAELLSQATDLLFTNRSLTKYLNTK